jgi:uncharacterized protein (TIGR02246 family)
VIVVSTTYAPEIHVRRPHIDVWVAIVVGLAAVVIALGAWIVVDRYTGPEHDAATAIDDAATAWSAGDAASAASLYTSDAILVTAGGEQVVGTDEIAARMTNAQRYGLGFERVAPVTTEGDFATTYVRSTDPTLSNHTLLTVFEMDQGKIARQWDFELGASPPFTARAIVP